MAGRWAMCGGGGQPVRVVHGDGQMLSIPPPVKVADILISHPHHYICHMSPELPSNKSPMLPLDHDLEPDTLYFLLPLPRLFPTSSAGPPSCCCRVSNHDTSLGEGHATPSSRDNDGGRQQQPRFGLSPLRLTAVRQMVDRISSPMRSAKKQVSPELSRSPATSTNSKIETSSPLLSPTYGSSKHRKRTAGIGPFSRRCNGFPREKRSPIRGGGQALSRSPSMSGSGREGGRSFMQELLCSKWKPGLGCISEADVVVTGSEELRLCLDRRRLTFDAKLPRSQSSSPDRLVDAYRSQGRERSPKPQRDDAYYSDRPTNHMSLGNYLFV